MVKEKIKLGFIIDHDLHEYRIPLFNSLNEQGYDVTVFHCGKKHANLNFKQIITSRIKYFGFEYRKIRNINNYDVIVIMQNLRILNLYLYTFNPFKKFKLILWGIGVSASTGLQTKRSIASIVRNFISYFSHGLIFYSDYPIKFYSKSNVTKTVIAHNTIDNLHTEDLSSFHKDSISFIGTLNKRKGIIELLSAFKQYIESSPKNISKLSIIGDGELKDEVELFIAENNLEKNIIMHGKVTNPELKKDILKSTIAMISLNQAGLSVLDSFSFGIPYITRGNAISGGEHLNIKNLKNGLILNDDEIIALKLNWIDDNINLMKTMGSNAYKYYCTERSMGKMIEAFDEAIKKSINS